MRATLCKYWLCFQGPLHLLGVGPLGQVALPQAQLPTHSSLLPHLPALVSSSSLLPQGLEPPILQVVDVADLTCTLVSHQLWCCKLDWSCFMCHAESAVIHSQDLAFLVCVSSKCVLCCAGNMGFGPSPSFGQQPSSAQQV